MELDDIVVLHPSHYNVVNMLYDLRVAAEQFRRAVIESGALNKVSQDTYFDQLRRLESCLEGSNYRRTGRRDKFQKFVDMPQYTELASLTPDRLAERLKTTSVADCRYLQHCVQQATSEEA